MYAKINASTFNPKSFKNFKSFYVDCNEIIIRLVVTAIFFI